MQLMLITKVGPALSAYRVDGRLVQPPRLLQDAVRNTTSQRDSTDATLFEPGLIEIRVGIRVQQLMRKLRRNWRIDGEAANAPILDSAQNLNQAFEVHRLLQHILHHFVDQWMRGNLDVANNGLKTRRRLWKDAGEQVFGACALHLRGDAFAL